MNKILILVLMCTICLGQKRDKRIIRKENFKNKELNDKIWNIEQGDGCPNCGWGNNKRHMCTD
jgi:hypothetical protein